MTNILTRQEYCGDVVNFKTTKHFRDKHNHYVDRSQWHITENVHEPIISRSDFETVQRILENAPVRRPNGDGEIHPLSGLLFCKDCGAKMHIRIDYRNGGKRHVAFCSEYHKGKAKNPNSNITAYMLIISHLRDIINLKSIAKKGGRKMAVSYKRLFHLMIDKGVTNAELMEKAGFSANIITRLKRDHYVALDSIEKICYALDCGVDDILEFIPEEKEHTTDD